MGFDGAGSKIHEIYKGYANSREYNEAVMQNHFDIGWLEGKLDVKDYLKLEDYILDYCSRNDELLFRLGFQYAWPLFQECMGKENTGDALF